MSRQELQTKQLMAKHGVTFKKSLGQNFLVDTNILARIVDVARLSEQSAVLEIGPGAGALTKKLAERVKQVVAVEIDQRLLPILAETLSSHENVSVVHGDVLKVDLATLWNTHFENDREVSVVANLPYYITTPIIMTLLEHRLNLRQMVIMMQKEVAERIVAKPGSKDYGSLSIAVQYYCEPEILINVPRAAFLPPPNVDSIVLGLRMRSAPSVAVKSEVLFFQVVRAAFAQRRKTLSNNLLAHYKGRLARDQIDAILEGCQVDPQRRAETLSIEEYARISDDLTNYF
jgi:16S rRNA (adenine1518-N6/adenine1519-N6)-dimethyltransferase